MEERGMSKSMATNIVKNGKAIQQTSDKWIFYTKQGAVVMNSDGSIITAYTNKYFDAKSKDIIKMLYGG